MLISAKLCFVSSPTVIRFGEESIHSCLWQMRKSPGVQLCLKLSFGGKAAFKAGALNEIEVLSFEPFVCFAS